MESKRLAQLFHMLVNDASSVPGPCLLRVHLDPYTTFQSARNQIVQLLNSTRACDDIHVNRVRKQVPALFHLIMDLLQCVVDPQTEEEGHQRVELLSPFMLMDLVANPVIVCPRVLYGT